MPIHFTLPYGGKPMHLVCVFEADRDPTDEEVRTSLALALFLDFSWNTDRLSCHCFGCWVSFSLPHLHLFSNPLGLNYHAIYSYC